MSFIIPLLMLTMSFIILSMSYICVTHRKYYICINQLIVKNTIV